MREFGPVIDPAKRGQILTLAKQIYDRAEPKREIHASEFAMEDETDRVVAHEVDLREEHERMRGLVGCAFCFAVARVRFIEE